MLINVDRARQRADDPGVTIERTNTNATTGRTEALAGHLREGLIEVPRGLKGVVVAHTEIGDVRGDEGFYHYRQYSAVDLARTSTVEDVWFLLFEGRLPSTTERATFVERVATSRAIPDEVAAVLPAIARSTTSPLDGFRTGLSLVAAHLGLRPVIDLDEDERKRDALRLCAVTPSLVTTLHRLRAGGAPVPPRPDLSWAENYLWMLDGVMPAPEVARAVECYLISTIDHGFNASTFTARVIASTGADVGACLVGAVGALSGPLHGGAPSRALELLDQIGPLDGIVDGVLSEADRNRIDEIVRSKLRAGEKLMGFGHPVYQGEDPRSTMLRDVAMSLGGPLAERARLVEQRVIELLDAHWPERGLRTNVEYYAGVVMARCGLAPEMFTPTFASSRVIGWSANVLEQAADGKILRPSARYVGPPAPQPVPVSASPAVPSISISISRPAQVLRREGDVPTRTG